MAWKLASDRQTERESLGLSSRCYLQTLRPTTMTLGTWRQRRQRRLSEPDCGCGCGHCCDSYFVLVWSLYALRLQACVVGSNSVWHPQLNLSRGCAEESLNSAVDRPKRTRDARGVTGRQRASSLRGGYVVRERQGTDLGPRRRFSCRESSCWEGEPACASHGLTCCYRYRVLCTYRYKYVCIYVCMCAQLCSVA